jgi:hypothetical protein
MLTDVFELNAFDEVTYKLWLTADISILETITHSMETFLAFSLKNCRFCYVSFIRSIEKSTFQNELDPSR